MNGNGSLDVRNEELGLPALPRAWRWSRMQDLLCRSEYGTSTKCTYEADGIPVLRIPNIAAGEIDLTDLKFATKTLDLDQADALRPGDVLMCRTNGSVSLIGRTAVVGENLDRPHSFASYLLRFRLLESKTLPKWVHLFANSLTGRSFIERNAASSAGQHNVSLRLIHSMPVPIAPLDEQRRIVAKIEELFSDLDAGVAALERAKANLKRYRAAVLKAAVEGKLTEQWRAHHPDVEPASELLDRILTERRHRWEQDQLANYEAKGKQPPKNWKDKYKEPAQPANFDAGVVPSGWEVASLEQLTDAERVICYGILMPKENVDEGVLYVKVRDMKGDRIDVSQLQRTAPEIAAKYERASLKSGDLLLAIRGTYGRVAVVPPELDGGNITQDSARIAVSPKISSEFVMWFLRSPDAQSYFKRVARGVAVKGVNIGDIRPCPVLLPPVEEQVVIAQEIERRLSVVDQSEVELQHSTSRAARLRQSILKRAFEGHLVPQDPNDEPASELLSRISAP